MPRSNIPDLQPPLVVGDRLYRVYAFKGDEIEVQSVCITRVTSKYVYFDDSAGELAFHCRARLNHAVAARCARTPVAALLAHVECCRQRVSTARHYLGTALLALETQQYQDRHGR